jgi:hypothetical protein
MQKKKAPLQRGKCNGANVHLIEISHFQPQKDVIFITHLDYFCMHSHFAGQVEFMAIVETFKICPKCLTRWKTMGDFLSDSAIELVGYQADLTNLGLGLLLFNHCTPGCSTSTAVFVSEFFDLYTGPHHPEVKALLPGCPRYCLDEKYLDRCDVVCECAFVREIIQTIRNMKKT